MKNSEKRIAKTLLAVMASITAVFALAGCDGLSFLPSGEKPSGEHVHEWGEWTQVTAPTCTEKGEEQRVCTLDETHVETQDIPATGEHIWDEGTTTVEPTCTKQGVKTFICTTCDTGAYTEEIPATGKHVWNEGETTVEPTCTKQGVKTFACTTCDTGSYTEEIPATGEHVWDEGEYLIYPTCTEKGLIDYSCTTCNTASYTEDVDELEHDEKACEGQAATCLEDGWEAYVYCQREGCGYTTYQAIPHQGHSFADGTCVNCPELDSDYKASRNLQYQLAADKSHYSVASIGLCKDSDVVIPETYKNIPVTHVAGTAFHGCKQITSITFPSSIVEIGNSAFYNCSNLEEINWGDNCSVDYIQNFAFANCTNLTEASLPESLTRTGGCLFSGCTSLKKLTVPFVGRYKEITTPENWGGLGHLFTSYDSSSTKNPLPTSLTEVVVTGGDRIIYSGFQYCETLESVTIPDSVTLIGERAFRNCTNLNEVRFGGHSQLETIDNYAFENCKSLASIILPDKLSTIGMSFQKCTALEEISIPDGITNIAHNAFEGCPKTLYNDYNYSSYLGNEDNPYLYLMKGVAATSSAVEIPVGTKIIGQYAFESCVSMKSISIPDTVIAVLALAFYKCTQLERAIIPDSVTKFGGSVFSGCSSLTEVKLPDALTTLPSDTFKNCTSLTSYVVSDSVKSIGSSAFHGCTKLKTVELGLAVKEIGGNAFTNCTNLNKVTFKNTEKWKAGSTKIEATDLADAGLAAYYLRKTYCTERWFVMK